MSRRRNPTRVKMQVTAQTPSSVLSSAALPGDAFVAQEAPYAVRGSTAHQPTGSSSRYATSPLVVATRDARVGLRAQPSGAFPDRKLRKGLPRPQLVPLALAPGRLPAGAEDRLEVIPTRFVGERSRDDRETLRPACLLAEAPAAMLTAHRVLAFGVIIVPQARRSPAALYWRGRGRAPRQLLALAQTLLVAQVASVCCFSRTAGGRVTSCTTCTAPLPSASRSCRGSTPRRRPGGCSGSRAVLRWRLRSAIRALTTGG